MDSEEFKCEICSSTFFKKRYLTKHIQRMHQTHNESKRATKCNIECKEDNCSEKFRIISELREHLESAHNLKEFSKCQKLTFNSKPEFLKWLADYEKRSNCKYVIACSEKKYSDHSYIVYNCHRSGFFKSQAKLQIKQLKAQGSVKIGHHCTSSLIVKDFESHTEVFFYEEHYKHEKELQHIRISKDDKQVIAGKLLEGVTERKIIKDLRNVDQEIQRKNLITNKDLHNIKKEFGINIKSHGSVLENIITNKATSVNYHEENKLKFLSLYSQITAIPIMNDDKAKQIRDHLNAIEHLLNIPDVETQKLVLNETRTKKSCESHRL